MKKFTGFYSILIIISMISLIPATDIPYLTGRVNDYAQILSPETIKTLSDKLKAHEDLTGNQIVILTIPTLNGENIEDYANNVFTEWSIGQRDKNNGLLIVVAPSERSVRIEVGYGLEGIVPDAVASQLIRHIMVPQFKEGNYEAGISECTNSIVKILEGGDNSEYLSNMEENQEDAGFLNVDSPDMSIIERILFGAFIFGIIGLFTAVGIFTPGVGWFLYVFLIPFWAIFPIVVIGTSGAFICLVIYLIGFPLAKIFIKKTAWYKKASKGGKSGGWISSGGFNTGSSSGSSWSSGSSSSFSGGGGSSGGGGASGSW
jgi:uncharacterized protein